MRRKNKRGKKKKRTKGKKEKKKKKGEQIPFKMGTRMAAAG